LVKRKASYKKLWKLLIDREINKTKLSEMSKVGASTLTKLSKGECVNMEIIIRICNALDCEICDILELVPDDSAEATSPKEN
jgi:DNA-binding Xre family transcriptional regulator